MTEDQLSIGDAMAYGFGMLAYLLLVNLVGGTLVGVGLTVLESGSSLSGPLGFGLVAIGGLIVAGGGLGILYKIVVDGVRRGTNSGRDKAVETAEDESVKPAEDEGVEVVPPTERGELSDADSLVETVVDRLREERTLRSGDLKGRLYPEHTLGCDDAEEWYDRVESLLSRDDRIKRAGGTGDRWTLAAQE